MGFLLIKYERMFVNYSWPHQRKDLKGISGLEGTRLGCNIGCVKSVVTQKLIC